MGLSRVTKLGEQLDFYHLSLLDDGMRKLVFGCLLWSVVGLAGVVEAVTPAPALTDREIAERLTRLETRLDEGLTGLRSDIAQLRADMGQLRAEMVQLRTEMVQMRADMQEQNRQLRAEMVQLRADMQEQTRQLREDMNIRFEEHSRLILGILAAFAALFVVNVSLVVWDRRTAARPFEEKVAVMAEELAESRSRWEGLLEAVRALGQQNQTVAAVLRRFNLL